MLINPKDLAKRTKESARTVSLRIKEKTWVGFEQLAKENQTTANALIGELADYYIESLKNSNLDLSDDAINHNKVNTIVEKTVRRLCRWMIDDSVRKMDEGFALERHTLGIFDNYFRGTHEEPNDGEYEIIEPSFVAFSGFTLILGDGDDATLLYPTINKTAKFVSSAFDEGLGFANVLYIPIEKYPDILCLIEAIETYCATESIKTNFDGDFMETVETIVNRYEYEPDRRRGPSVLTEQGDKNRKSMLWEIGHELLKVLG